MIEPLRVLVVEDEAAILLQLEAMIEDEGHIVVGTAMSSREAIAHVDAMVPELVLLDLNLLDGPTGPEVARHARNIDSIKVVFLTANVSRLADDLDGAIGVLAKPCSRAPLRATIRYLTECLRTPPPRSACPPEFMPGRAFERRMGIRT